MTGRATRTSADRPIKVAGNPEAAAFERQQSVQKKLAEKAARAVNTPQPKVWVFKVDPTRQGAGQQMLLPIRNNTEVMEANNGNQNLRIVDYVHKTSSIVIRNFLRGLISSGKLKGVTEVVNPSVSCSICGFRGDISAIQIHFAAAHMGVDDDGEIDDDEPELPDKAEG